MLLLRKPTQTCNNAIHVAFYYYAMNGGKFTATHHLLKFLKSADVSRTEAHRPRSQTAGGHYLEQLLTPQRGWDMLG